MDILKNLEEMAPDLYFELSEGTPVVRLGLIITLYFREGYTAESKNKVIECFAQFKKAFGPQLNGLMYKRYTRLTEANFAKAIDSILKTEPNEQYHWQLSSAETAFEAPAYSISVSNSPEIHGDQKRSFLKVIIPWSVLKEPGGAEYYHDWATYLCNQIGADHGYGGLSSILPYDYHSYAPLEYQLALQYPGLEVDSLLANFKRELLNSIKGVNWYTIISDRFIEKVGGIGNLRNKFSSHGSVKLFDYVGGVIIRAGNLPELGSTERLPASYVDVNKIVKPLRILEPDQLHTYSADNNTFDQQSSAAWYARFDSNEPTASSPSRIQAGKPCTASGYWFSPAQSNSLGFFNVGDLMPDFKGSSWGATFWYWSGESK